MAQEGAKLLDDGKVEIPTMVDAIVERLRARVISGAVRPGERLKEEQLTELLGVSRPPLREAMRILQEAGLLVSIPRRGFIVRPMTAEDIREIYSLRFALERLAVELGVPVTDPDRLEPLRVALDAMRRAEEDGDTKEVLEANSAFHRGIVELPGHSRLISAYETIRLQLELCMAYNLELRERLRGGHGDSHARHVELLNLIESGDRESLIQAIENHGDKDILNNLDDLFKPGALS